MAFSYSPRIITDGLVLYLDAGNPYSYVSGSLNWNDLSRSQTSGSLINGPMFNSANNGSIVFDGSDEWVNVTYNSSLGLSSQGTLGVWCYPTQLNQQSYAGLIGMTIGGSANQQSYYLHWRQIDNVVQGGIGNSGTYNTASTPVPTSINWYYYVFTWNNNTLNLYQNGISVVSPVSQTINAQALASDVKIGGRMFYPAAPGLGNFKGRIATTQIYNRGLSASEVLQNYNATKGRFGLT